MNQFNPRIGLLFIALCLSTSLLSQELNINYLSTYHTGVFDEGAAEIVAYDKEGTRLFFVNGDNKSVDVLDITNPEMPTLIQQIDISPYGGGLNSVDVFEGLLAVAVQNDDKQVPGVVAFFDTDGNFINTVAAGALPDMLIFTEDGQKVLVANEGEPNDDYDVDPEGSVTIVDLSSGVENATSIQLNFAAFNDKKMALMNRGIRIYGNNGAATVAQDMEPEYIALSPDGALAYVGCQENNAMAVVDIANASIVDILPLGYKNHQKGSPKLKQYLLNEIPWYSNFDLGTPVYDGGETIKLGGFSGLCYDPLTSTDNQLSFWAVPDRGPNESTVNAGASQNLRPFKLPNYQARLEKLIYNKSLDMFFIDANPIYLTREDGVTPISGRGNIAGHDEIPVTRTDATHFPQVDYSVNGLDYHALEFDAFGGDFEGVIRTVDYSTRDFSFWLCDEYRPAIYHFDPNGKLLNRFVAKGTSLLGDTPQAEGYYGTETLPAVYNKRRANRGFEAIAWDYDKNIIYAFIQSPLYNPSSITKNNSDVIRILGINPENGEPVKEFVYLLERNKDAGVGLSRVDKIGDAVYAGDGKFYVLERDSSDPADGDTGKKYIYEINIKGATNILGTALSNKMTSTGADDKTLEMMSADELHAAGIQSVFKMKMLNLPSLGYLPSDKPEGLALLPDGGLVVLNDNDFGFAGAGISDKSSMGFISFEEDYGFDASDKDDAIAIASQPTMGMYQPDAIASYEVNGKTYIITANEGDSRDYDGYSEEDRVDDLVLDPMAFPGAENLQEETKLGRLKTTYVGGDLDQDGMNEYIYSYGGRSFSIWDEYGNQVFDSGSDFEQILAANYAEFFNSNNDDNDSQDKRSDDKGAEPEAVAIAEIGNHTYAFIGLERMGGVMVYEVSDPHNPVFVTYDINRNFTADAETPAAGDLGVEDIIIIAAEDSPNGQTMMVTANEVSGTISLFTLNGNHSFSDNQAAFAMRGSATTSATLNAYPNPFTNQFSLNYTTQAGEVSIKMYDQLGRMIAPVYQGTQTAGRHTLEVDLARFQLNAGVYTLSIFNENQPTQTLTLVKE